MAVTLYIWDQSLIGIEANGMFRQTKQSSDFFHSVHRTTPQDFDRRLDFVLLECCTVIVVWSFGPVQNYNLLLLAPEASGITLSLSISFVQFGSAAGAAAGGVAVNGSTIMAIGWMGAVAGTAALLVAFVFHRWIGRYRR